jgi:putative transposase
MRRPIKFHKYIRLAKPAYRGQQFYFVTICCHERKRIFANPTHCERLLSTFRGEASARAFAIHSYCIMPDHFHFLAEGTSGASDLLSFVKSVKIKSSRVYSRRTSRVLWQRRFFDHILRAGESPESVAWYIWMNPVRQELSPTPGEYPFAGSFTGLIDRLAPRPESWTPPWKPTKAPASEGGRYKA